MNGNNQRQIFKAMHTQIRDILATITLKGGSTSLAQVAKNIDLDGQKFTIIFELLTDQIADFEGAKAQAEQALLQVFPDHIFSFIVTSHREEKKPTLPHLPPIVAIASGKGGVGKSTVAVNLAIAMARQGLKVGLLDADIYGPSIPKMMGINEKPTTNEDKKLNPLIRYGVRCMSIGLLLDEERPLIWRGPMAQGALMQLLRDVAWGDLDLLLIDMPPGTGDIQLSLTQQANLSGAIIVSTPQDIALIDARKGLNMFRRVHVPILGIIENMSLFSCPHCHHQSPIFGHGGALAEAERLQVPFLGSLPLTLETRLGGDEGIPIATDPQNATSQVFQEIAKACFSAIKKS